MPSLIPSPPPRSQRCSTKCSERTILRAYHTLCAACGERKGFCCKCQGPIDDETTAEEGATKGADDEAGDDHEGEEGEGGAPPASEATPASGAGAAAAAAAAASSAEVEALPPTGGFATKPQAIRDAEAELEDLYASACGLRERKRRSRIRVLERQLGQREEAATYAADARAEEKAEADAAGEDEGADADAAEGEGETETSPVASAGGAGTGAESGSATATDAVARE